MESLLTLAKIHIRESQIRQRLRAVGRVGILSHETLQGAYCVVVLLLGDVGLTQLIRSRIDIVATVGRHDCLQSLYLILALVLHAIGHSTLILRVVLLLCVNGHCVVVALQSLRKLTLRIVYITTTVIGIGTVRVTLRAALQEVIEGLGRRRHILIVEVAVTHIILRHSVLITRLGGACNKVAVALQSHTRITTRVGNLTQPERRQSIVLRI